MRCKKHFWDSSSSVGVCASCLREKLAFVIADQYQPSHYQSHAHQPQPHLHHHDQAHHSVVNDNCREFDRNLQPPPLIFPQSVSPYISRRKSEPIGGECSYAQQRHQVSVSHHSRFFSTPQAGPTYANTATTSSNIKRRRGKIEAISRLFRSRSQKLGQSSSDPEIYYSDPNVVTRKSCKETSAAGSSLSWILKFVFGRRKRTKRLSSINEPETSNTGGRRARGMSPESTGEEDDGCPPFSPALGHVEWRGTPRSAHATSVTCSPITARRPGFSGTRPSPARSNLTLCMSPLVRASPTRHRNGKAGGLGTHDFGYPGEITAGGSTVKPHVSAASSFFPNRSRKFADFGRLNQKR